MSTARLSANASTRVLLSSTRSYSTLTSRVARSVNTRTSLHNASLFASATRTNNLASVPTFGVNTRLFSTTMVAPGKCNLPFTPSVAIVCMAGSTSNKPLYPARIRPFGHFPAVGSSADPTPREGYASGSSASRPTSKRGHGLCYPPAQPRSGDVKLYAATTTHRMLELDFEDGSDLSARLRELKSYLLSSSS